MIDHATEQQLTPPCLQRGPFCATTLRDERGIAVRAGLAGYPLRPGRRYSLQLCAPEGWNDVRCTLIEPGWSTFPAAAAPEGGASLEFEAPPAGKRITLNQHHLLVELRSSSPRCSVTARVPVVVSRGWFDPLVTLSSILPAGLFGVLSSFELSIRIALGAGIVLGVGVLIHLWRQLQVHKGAIQRHGALLPELGETVGALGEDGESGVDGSLSSVVGGIIDSEDGEAGEDPIPS